MKSLQSHSTASSGDHGQLGFHPACPVCRAERLFGTPVDGVLSSRRLPALAAAAALAVMPFAAAAAPVQANVSDEQHVGIQDPDSLPTEDPADDPSFKPPKGPDGPDQDQGPVVDTDAPTNDGEADPLDEGNTPPPSPVVAPPAPVTPDLAPPTVPSAPAPPAPPAVPPVPVLPGDAPNLPAEKKADAPNPSVEKKTSAEPRSRRTKSPAPQRRGARPPVIGHAEGTPARPGSTPSAQTPSGEATTSTAAAKTSAPSGGAYTVKAGDSLWSIARHIAGPKASNAKVASLVDRLWTLNAGRIGTGDPDLLNIGTELAMP